ncbi:hypothetical protein [Nocardia sp. NPDC004260]
MDHAFPVWHAEGQSLREILDSPLPQRLAPEREGRAAQGLSMRRLVRQVIEPGEVFEIGDLLARLAGLGIAMTPDKVVGILDYWAARSQLTPASTAARPNPPPHSATVRFVYQLRG